MVHLPELVLCSSGFCRLGRQFGVGMHFNQREVPKDKPHSVEERLHQVPGDRLGLGAGRALVVAVFEQEHRAMCGTGAVVGGDKPSDWVCLLESFLHRRLP